MAETYVDYVLTAQGRALMARVIAGESLTFTRVAIGSGFDYNTANFPSRTSLVNEELSLTDLTMSIESATVVKITAVFSSSDLEESFYYREVGLYVEDPDDSTNEILYAYGNCNDNAEYITPNVDEYTVQKQINFMTTVGNSANVHIILSSNAFTDIPFSESDWVYDSNSELYKLELGSISESIKVFTVTNEGKFESPFATITRDSLNGTTVECLCPFDGCVVSI